MRFKYSKVDNPASLMLPVVISTITGPLVHDVDAKIDTGADITTVPTPVRIALGLEPVAYVTVRGPRAEKWTDVPVFQVRFRMGGSEWITVNAVDSPRDYSIIGRDILQHFTLTAHGPEEWFELNLPAKA
jgi:hypothetical protein